MNLHTIITTQQDPDLAQALENYIAETLPQFKRVLEQHPIRDPSPGCISVAEAFWLHGLVRSLKPELVIESGTYEGYSLFFIWQAAHEYARILSFDPKHEPTSKLKGVEYFTSDWMDIKVRPEIGSRTMIFFDDHINQGIRLKQASDQGFRHVVFHDNYITPYQSHLPIRFYDLLGLVRVSYIFDRIRSDPIFLDGTWNPQNYRWLTYLELEPRKAAWKRWLRRWRYLLSRRNPYAEW